MQHEMHLYNCKNCRTMFAIEADEEINQAEAGCPICGDEDLGDAGYGTFTVTIPAEETA